jgi:hypothetical protein
MSYRSNNIEPNDAYSLYLAYHEGNTGFARRSFEGKQWLIDVANKVQANTNLYGRQYSECERDLNRRWYERLFSLNLGAGHPGTEGSWNLGAKPAKAEGA